MPNQRLAVGDPGCFILQDEDGQVFGLWFEDAMSGDAYSADPTKVRKILVDNSLGSLLDATYSSYPDGDRGGYTIQFHRDNWHAPG
ncbi:hypothetical protein [Glycomyces albidus]|uniref:Uncharacterized protein n=1 Tax=Glycomyces albidus TaxID=2656774 RepID=A0A6L5GHH0_9ACTN|nr:hypothetical protein [Glycomyces albidus]MQM28995.1 hypothetical protein [Glycomyces albidus]